MARRSHMTMQKRQRELRRAEKAARKRAKRHGQELKAPKEPTPTIDLKNLFEPKPPADDEAPERLDKKEIDQQEDDEN